MNSTTYALGYDLRDLDPFAPSTGTQSAKPPLDLADLIFHNAASQPLSKEAPLPNVTYLPPPSIKGSITPQAPTPALKGSLHPVNQNKERRMVLIAGGLCMEVDIPLVNGKEDPDWIATRDKMASIADKLEEKYPGTTWTPMTNHNGFAQFDTLGKFIKVLNADEIATEISQPAHQIKEDLKKHAEFEKKIGLVSNAPYYSATGPRLRHSSSGINYLQMPTQTVVEQQTANLHHGKSVALKLIEASEDQKNISHIVKVEALTVNLTKKLEEEIAKQGIDQELQNYYKTLLEQLNKQTNRHALWAAAMFANGTGTPTEKAEGCRNLLIAHLHKEYSDHFFSNAKKLTKAEFISQQQDAVQYATEAASMLLSNPSDYQAFCLTYRLPPIKESHIHCLLLQVLSNAPIDTIPDQHKKATVQLLLEAKSGLDQLGAAAEMPLSGRESITERLSTLLTNNPTLLGQAPSTLEKASMMFTKGVQKTVQTFKKFAPWTTPSA